jgi:hypothetical protein
MGLDYDYKIYLKKEKILDALEYLLANCDEKRTGFEIDNGKLIKVNRFHNRIEKSELENHGLSQTIDSCIIFKTDNKIVEYYLKELTQNYQHDTDDEDDYLTLYQNDKDSYWIGNIEIHINDYSEKEPGLVELEFWAVTSDMSFLFSESESIDEFFKNFCSKVEADFGCLYMEDSGYRLIWFEGEKMNLTVPVNWNSFQEHGFRTVVKKIFKNRKK